MLFNVQPWVWGEVEGGGSEAQMTSFYTQFLPKIPTLWEWEICNLPLCSTPQASLEGRWWLCILLAHLLMRRIPGAVLVHLQVLEAMILEALPQPDKWKIFTSHLSSAWLHYYDSLHIFFLISFLKKQTVAWDHWAIQINREDNTWIGTHQECNDSGKNTKIKGLILTYSRHLQNGTEKHQL